VADLFAAGVRRAMRQDLPSAAGEATTPATPSFVPIVSEAIPAATVERASGAPGIEVELAGAVVRISSGMDWPADRGVARGASVGIPIMINVPAGARVLLATRPIDFRKGAHSLTVLAQEALAEDPFSGAVIVYRAKRGDRLKILVWDSSGLVLVWKQLQQGSFRWPPIMDGVMKLSPVEFAALFDGLDWTRVQTAKGILKPSVAA
jgi:transposase